MRKITLVDTHKLKHIEGFSKKRALWLEKKIVKEGLWTVPLKIESENFLVMDGQHRMEVAISLGLQQVPCLLYTYDEVELWSLRDQYEVTPEIILERVLAENILPYKTAKHAFPDSGDLKCSIKLQELIENTVKI